MKKERRWLKSAIAAASQDAVAMPWQRGARRKPAAILAAIKATAPAQPRAQAAH